MIDVIERERAYDIGADRPRRNVPSLREVLSVFGERKPDES